MGRLAGKVAMITGGASGLGEATALLFAEEGAKVVVADLHEERGAAVAAAIRNSGGESIFLKTDVSLDADLVEAVALAEREYGLLNVVVANAGIGGEASLKRLENVTDREWDKILDINLKSVWRTFKVTLPALRRAGGGAVTSSASLSGLSIMGDSFIGAYTASKFGAVGLTRYFASEVAKDNVRVNCVCPGRMRTNIDESFGFDDRRLEQARAARAMTEQAPGRRWMADPREVAYLHLFLCSDEASFITGQAILADGGADLFSSLETPGTST
jgi:NAD(P)-dependent dehydrogenase (short-subunit alcohol dehydrogenase family)